MTPVQKQGIVKGVTYVIVGPAEGYDKVNASGGAKAGSLIILNEDDETNLPFFDIVAEDGSTIYKRAVVDISTTKIARNESIAAPAVAFSVEVKADSTLIYVNKAMSASQVSALLVAAGL